MLGKPDPEALLSLPSIQKKEPCEGRWWAASSDAPDAKWEDQLRDEEYENQLNILTKRVGEVGTENHNLNMNLREWQAAYAQVKKENDELKKKLEEPKKIARKKKEVNE